MNCRLATVQDAIHIYNIKKDLVANTNFFITIPPELNSQEEEFLMKRNFDNGGATFVMEDEKKSIVGFIFLSKGSRQRVSHVVNIGMGVKRENWSQGIGTILLNTGIEWAQKNSGIKKLALGVFSNNPRAIKLYEKLGFKVEGVKKDEIKLNDENLVDDILMGLKVN
ncbi:GNAT family N-acetyltransferase [Jeotgalibacillus marinus]|uniref:GNAT family protein n=1 Tax=Jeotgalibacillus marinus TaxID=86667 RepID=A0ABV3Q395_9BACL